MKSFFKICLILFGIMLFIISCSGMRVKPAGFVHTQGKIIVDASGNPVWLVGFGLGGWLVPEGYMLKTPGGDYDAPIEIRNAIIDLVGKDNADKFYEAYTANYVGEKDLETLASWGVNSIRIPFSWRNLMEDQPPYNLIDKGWETIDQAVRWCGKYKMYVILDMHAAPGGQSRYNIADSTGKALLWDEPETYQPLCIDIWQKLAEKYADNKWVIGYDLLNEPYGDGYADEELRDLYERITKAIRKVDHNHMIIAEGGKWAQDFAPLVPPWDDDLVYSFHSYPPSSSEGAAYRWLDIRDEYNVPIWHGETGENSISTYAAATEFLKEYDIGVSWWTHKKISTGTSPFSAQLTDGWRKILEYWGGSGLKPSPEEAMKGLMEQAEALSIDKCFFNPDMVRAFGLHTDAPAITPPPFKAPELVIPGKIEAEYYTTFMDNSKGNNGGTLRTEDVDIEMCAEGGYNVGWVDKDEWLAYQVKVKKAGKYKIEVRVARQPSGEEALHFELDGKALTDKITVPSTGGWQKWTSVFAENVVIPAGEHELKLVMDGGSFNVNWIKID
ncbi:MAG: cellulase family glycosylhydrolase [Spirochaetales bacterium]|nr:cellulase family glycosylhydrolase [Spirochaetales bacterium]